MKRSGYRLLFSVAALLGFVSAQDAPQNAVQDAALAGEAVEIIVPFSEGGGTDIWARTLTPYLQTHLGASSVQVLNVTGGSGVQGGNEFAVGREHDALTLLVSSGSNVFPYLFGDEAVRYEFNDYTALMGTALGAVIYVSPDTGVTDVASLCNSESELIYGGVSAAGLDIVSLVSFELLNLNLFPILGYEGRGGARVAFEQGETTIDNQATSAFRESVEPLVDEGKAAPLYTLGILGENGAIVRDPEYPELPHFGEVYETCTGSALSGVELDAYKAVLAAGYASSKNLWVHSDAPPERVAALQAAADAVVADEAFQSSTVDIVGAYEVTANDETLASFAAASQLSDEAFTWLTTFLRETYDLEF